MAPSFTSPIKCNTVTSFSPLFFSLTHSSCNISLPRRLHRNVHVHCNSLSPFSYQSSIQRNLYSERQRGLSLVAFDAKNLESGGEDNKPLDDDVMKLNSAFKDKKTHKLFDIHADECGPICNFLSFFQAFQGKKQVLEFFSNLTRILRKNVKIVVNPTLPDGMDVGIQWKFEWNKIYFPLGKGFSVHLFQTYRGKAVIRNFERLMEPLLHLEPFRLKMMVNLTKFAEKMGLFKVSESGNKAKWKLCILIAVLSVAVLLFFMKIAS
ncbi:hypothetical protein RIF29_40800 [Crotalaria pallida]|uniref:Transmembrane protein n=1 Tax=Crotalaria pallida TaxID=3830 RepID=A0AAN9E4I7_CROPI